MNNTDDLRILGYTPLTVPSILKKELPVSPTAAETVNSGRKAIQDILSRKDKRLMVVVGPCSIHDEKGALDYANRLKALKEEVGDTLFLIMRVYFEKPRTTIGWKGLINDPKMDGSCHMEEGLQRSRQLLLDIADIGLPTATEMLDTITPQYLSDLVTWAAVGARTTESQPHREMASGLSMPVGFKNSTDGNLSSAINAVVAGKTSQSFLGIDQDGNTSIVSTGGNPWCHIVLRGGKRPNYDPISIEETRLKLIIKDLPETIMVDCSHGNSMKKFKGQPVVCQSVINQVAAGNMAISGLMLESNLFEGNQPFSGDLETLKYGVSITDECISWKTTEHLLRWANEKLKKAV